MKFCLPEGSFHYVNNICVVIRWTMRCKFEEAFFLSSDYGNISCFLGAEQKIQHKLFSIPIFGRFLIHFGPMLSFPPFSSSPHPPPTPTPCVFAD